MEKYLKSFNLLTDKEIEDFVQSSSQRVLNKGEYFIREGEVCNEVAFVKSGTLRSYYISEKGEEITYCIIFPNNLMAAYSSFISGKITEENMQALTYTELSVIPKKTIHEFAKHSPNWVEFLKVMAEQQYLELEKRIFQMQKNHALNRYANMIKNQPEYVQKIPLQYLASYLGITQRHLSRIRREIAF
ncbi:Crp/Fnr family transcriptional regulator [Pararhodonellum marinum]|uniref:Crp/Fnr family transcriptional regulator n=1 Tax=Pararhodonellum marinum TaxID=2755358 RepID=UPI00188EA2A9|nr:Crp/Fnr family transcriptional regulator [Pararhodonellum marinum]